MPTVFQYTLEEYYLHPQIMCKGLSGSLEETEEYIYYCSTLVTPRFYKQLSLHKTDYQCLS